MCLPRQACKLVWTSIYVDFYFSQELHSLEAYINFNFHPFKSLELPSLQAHINLKFHISKPRTSSLEAYQLQFPSLKVENLQAFHG